MEMTASELAAHIRKEFAKVIVGQDEILDQLLVVVLTGGHALIEGVPGLAKTLAVKCLAHLFGLQFHRVQCTPDLIPADILGGNIFHTATSEFRLHRGPIFTDLLLVDEINRMPPRTQSALLEAMEELQVTIDGTSYPLSAAFSVFATQNPVEFEGTYPLPEAQLDRFLLKIQVGYPSAAEERSVLERHHTAIEGTHLESAPIESVSFTELAAARQEVRRVRVEPAMFDYLLAVVRRTREWPAVSLGASPRAAAGLLIVAKGYAARDGRDYLIPDDVKEAALPCLRHRLILKPEVELEGFDPDRVIKDILAAVPLPK